MISLETLALCVFVPRAGSCVLLCVLCFFNDGLINKSIINIDTDHHHSPVHDSIHLFIHCCSHSYHEIISQTRFWRRFESLSFCLSLTLSWGDRHSDQFPRWEMLPEAPLTCCPSALCFSISLVFYHVLMRHEGSCCATS